MPEVPVIEDIDPAAELGADMLVSRVARARLLLERLDSIQCCVRKGKKGDYDHSRCDPYAALDLCLTELKKSGLACQDLVPGFKGGLTFIVKIFSKFTQAECPFDCNAKPADGTVITDEDSLIHYVRVRVKALGIPHGIRQVALRETELYYDRRSHDFWGKDNKGVWQTYSESAAAKRLQAAGADAQPAVPFGLSPVERELVNVRDTSGIDLAMPLAGYTEGLHRIKGLSVLVTKSYQMPVTKEGQHGPEKDWPHIHAIIGGLLGFGTEDEPEQGDYFCHKLKCDRAALIAEIRSGGLATLIAGMPDIGKTVLLKIIRATLGGRSACAAGYLTEKTTFNGDLCCAEVHHIDDGNPFSDRLARRRFANLIKASSASDEVWVHDKGKTGLSLPLYRRLFILTNQDSLDAMPEMEASLLDKVMLLLASPFKMPAGLQPLPPMGDTQAYKAFLEILEEEIPFFCWWLDNFQFPKCLEQRRFGTEPYKNPQLLAQIKELGVADEVHYLVQQVLFQEKLGLDLEGELADRGQVRVIAEGTVVIETNALLSLLLNCKTTSHRAKLLFTSPKSLGNALREVKLAYRELYKSRRSNSKSHWTITKE